MSDIHNTDPARNDAEGFQVVTDAAGCRIAGRHGQRVNITALVMGGQIHRIDPPLPLGPGEHLAITVEPGRGHVLGFRWLDETTV